MNMISDFMWEEIKTVIPTKIKKVGRPSADPYQVLNGIIFVLRTGIQWRFLPQEYGPKSTVHGTFIKWERSGILDMIMQKAITFYQRTITSDIQNWLAADSSFSKAPFAKWGGKNPTDRGRNGIKKGIIVDWNGAPIAVAACEANKHDAKFFISIYKAIKPPINNSLRIIAADSAFDSKKLYSFCKKQNIVLFTATNRRRNQDAIITKPSNRWVVERTFGWLSWFRSIKVCWSKTKDSFLGFLRLASAIQLFKMGVIFG